MRTWKNSCGTGAHLFIVGCLTLAQHLVHADKSVAEAPSFALENDIRAVPFEGVKQPPLPGKDDSLPSLEPGDLIPPPSIGKDDASIGAPMEMPQMPPPGIEPPELDAPPPGQPPGGPKRITPPARVNKNTPIPPRMGGANRPPNGRNMPSRMAAVPQKNNKNVAADEEDILKVVPQTCKPAKGEFNWNFEDEKLINILRQVSDLLCKTIVVNDSIGESLKLTIIGKSPLRPKDAWDVLMASLAAKGLALIEQGKTWTVVKRNESKSYPTPMYDDPKLARNNEEIGTLFYKVQHTSQDVLKNVTRALLSPSGLVESVGDQFIIVIDSNSNIRRLGSIFSQVDIEDAINKIHIIPLFNADVRTVEKQLRELFDVAAGPRGPTPRARRSNPSQASKSSLEIDKIIADDRTNSLIVVTDKDSFEKLKEVAALVDQPPTDQGSKGKIHVKKLRFADAKKIAETLSAVVQQGRSSRYGRRRGDDNTHELFEGEVKITAHENTNTLVTVASANDYRSLLSTINKLDVRKEQVYVEAVILDVEVTDQNEFGINLFGGLEQAIPGLSGTGLGVVANPGGRQIIDGLKGTLEKGAVAGANISGLGSNSLGALAVLGNFMSGGVAGFVGPSIGDNKIPSFGAVLQAFSTNSNVDVLSTPYLLTTDNQQAEMSVGEKVPVLKGTSNIGGGTGVTGIPFQNISHEDVKLTFKITPHVGADDNVRLDVEQEVNELGGQIDILNQKHYKIRTKSAKTTLVLKDQQTGVIGGLIHQKTHTVDSKIPFLGDIPLLGWLFKNRTSNNERRSLLLILTPYVIRTDDDYRKIVERKLKEREEFARLYYGGKIKNYNKYIDYDKKPGPLSSMLLQLDSEMNKVENGGSGDGSETVIAPKENIMKSDNLSEASSFETGGASLPELNLGANSEGQSAQLGGDNYNNDFEFSDDYLEENFDDETAPPEILSPGMNTVVEGN